jgi:hypothetical protein
MPEKPTIPEADSDEAAVPDARDIQNADDLAETNELLSALWNAKPIEDKK